MATKNLPAKRPGTAIVDWKAIVAAAAQKQQKAAARMGSESAWASFKAGVMVIGGAAVQGNSTDIIVLSVMSERAWYAKEYDPNAQGQAPDCYAYELLDGKKMSPHADSADPQSSDCASCAMSAWGSDPKGGRGQACRQGVKIAFLPAGKPEDLEGPIFFARTPPTSIKNVKGMMDFFGAQELPTFTHIVRMSVAPDAKTQFQVKFDIGKPLPPALQQGVAARLDEAEKALNQPYPKREEAAAGKQPAAKKRRF